MMKVIPLIVLSLVLLGIATPIIPVFAENTTTVQNKENTPAVRYIQLVEAKINLTVSLAERYNITIPDNMTVLIEEAKENIMKAYEELSNGNINIAVKYATIASLKIAPVIVYVMKNLPPDAKDEVKKARIMNEIKTREEILERIKAMINNLTSAGVEIPETVKEKINILEELLANATKSLESGKYNETHRYLHMFGVIAKNVTVESVKATKKCVREIQILAVGMKKMGIITVATVKVVRKAITLLNESRAEEAESMLTSLLDRLDTVLPEMEKLYNISISVNVTVATEAIELILNMTKETRENIDFAISLIHDNDTDSAITVLTNVLDDINETLTKLREMSIPEAFKENALKIRNTIREMWGNIEQIRANVFAKLSMGIDRTLVKLEKVKRAYERGKLPKDKVIMIFQVAEEKLEKLKSILEDKAPQWLIEKIDKAIEWIKSNMPQ